MLKPILDVGVDATGPVSRRGFFKYVAGGAAVATMSWRDALLAQSDKLRSRGKSMILLWMDGGPSQYETFNPKPGSKFQGPARAIPTCVPGVKFAEYWPETAKRLKDFALIRSMVSKEREHDRAIALVRTGYPFNVAIRYPTFGSLVAMERDAADFELPAFVRVGKPRIATRDVDSGVLGVKYAPFWVKDAGALPEDVTTPLPTDVLRRRLKLADQLDGVFAQEGGRAAVAEKRAIYKRTEKFVLSPRLGTFNLDGESAKLRDRYGRTSFGQGCLLARRLVEQGVSFVEVLSTGERSDQGWDTHKRGFKEGPPLYRETDRAYSALLDDMRERGLLENTLVVWMGEFGRTPRLKPDGGRDHYSKGWLAALAGAGVQGGRVIGKTDKDGKDVTDRPVTVPDLFTTFCHVLGMDPHEEYVTADDRPIKYVEGGQVVSELFS